MKKLLIVLLLSVSACTHEPEGGPRVGAPSPRDIASAYTTYITKYNSFTKYYVSPSGSGTTCSSASPCSIQQGVTMLGANRAIMFNDGTYTLTSNLSTVGSGTSSQRSALVSVNYGGAKIVHNGGPADGDPILRTNGGSFLDFVGLDWSGTQKCWTTFAFPNSGSGGYTFAYNKIHDIATNANTTTGGPGGSGTCGSKAGGGGIGSGGVSGAFTVEKNIIWNIGVATAQQGHFVHGVYISNPNTTIINNVIHDISGNCVTTYGGTNGSNTGITITNNTLNKCAQRNVGEASVDLSGGNCNGTTIGAGFTVINNILSNSGRGWNFWCDNSGAIQNSTLTYNLEYSNGASGWQNTIIRPTNVISGNPNFVNAAGGDYHLNSPSPASGAGRISGAPSQDIEGNIRPSPPAVGAYDTNSTPPPPPPSSGTNWVTNFISGGNGPSQDWVGDDITIANNNLQIVGVCRWIVAGNSASITVGWRNPDGSQIANSSASVPSSGVAGGQWNCVDLSSPITLAANAHVLLISAEQTTNNRSNCANSTKTVTSVARVNGYSLSTTGALNSFQTNSGACGVGFKYGTTTPPAVVAVSISPTWLHLTSGQAATFTATVTGYSSNPGVNWSITPSSAGSIAGGAYTAPTVTSTTNVTVRATSQEDNTKSASASVVIDPPPISNCERRFRIYGASWASNTVTLQVNNSAVPNGSYITLAGASPANYNGTWTLTSVTPTQMRYTLTSAPGTWTSGGVVSFTPVGCVGMLNHP